MSLAAGKNPAYAMRSCYVNFAEHLQNAWNVNFLYEDAPCQWSEADWTAFFRELEAFGFTDFQIWIPPTLAKAGPHREPAAEKLRRVLALAHEVGLTFHPMLAVNTIGGEWYFACPNDPDDRAGILEFWSFWSREMKDADYFTIFPGDPGGCNRNGCTHKTFIELAREITDLLKADNPGRTVVIGTWGTPFTGWGEDMRHVDNWDGSWQMLVDPAHAAPEVPCHIWNGSPERVAPCMRDLLAALPSFPEDTMVSINAGFNPDCEPDGEYDARPWAAKIAQTHSITSWDYSASEGELVCYPHFRAAKFARKRHLETAAAPYTGALCYTMSPKLNLLMLYCAARLMINPDSDPDSLAADFTEKVFGDRAIGPLMKAFEIVPGWGYEETPYTRAELIAMFTELEERLLKAPTDRCVLPIFPDAAEYKESLLWHARNFLEMLGDSPDRERIREDYRTRAMAIYEIAPMAADERSRLSAEQYAKIGLSLKI